MSHQIIGSVIDCLLKDETLRVRFAIDPVGTLLDLSVQGFRLTQDEIDMLSRTDARMWFWSRELLGHRTH